MLPALDPLLNGSLLPQGRRILFRAPRGLRSGRSQSCRTAVSTEARRRHLSLVVAALFCALLSALPAHAIQPGEMLADPGLEMRAREVSRALRCLVCRNQSIDDSDADLARDLRVLVRERISAGDTNDQVVAYVQARYGDFVLLRPPFATGTLLLWLGPALILLLGGLAVARYYRRPAPPDTPPLSPDEHQRLAAMLDETAPSTEPRRAMPS